MLKMICLYYCKQIVQNLYYNSSLYYICFVLIMCAVLMGHAQMRLHSDQASYPCAMWCKFDKAEVMDNWVFSG